MGHQLVDFTGFPAAWLHHRLGLNVAIPVLPLHGPRRIGLRSGDGFLSGDYIDTVHMQAQAVWDVRRLVGWLRARGARTIGAYGVSLGAYTTALLAAFEADLACVIAGISVTCYVSAVRWNLPPFLVALAERIGPPWAEIERLCRVISPLALPPRVAPERRYLFGALGDRLASPYDLEARYSTKRDTQWVGYKLHLTETYEPEYPDLITKVLTTPATTPDCTMGPPLVQALAARIGEPFVDGKGVSKSGVDDRAGPAARAPVAVATLTFGGPSRRRVVPRLRRPPKR